MLLKCPLKSKHTNYYFCNTHCFCNLFITEVANPENNHSASYIEIKTIYPRKITSKPTCVVDTLNNHGTNLQGFVLPDDGYIIICNHRIAFQRTYNKPCDFEDFLLIATGHNPISIVENYGSSGRYRKLSSAKYIDSYGYPGTRLSESFAFTNGKATCEIDYPYSLSSF